MLFGAGAFISWGLFPGFFPLLLPAGSVEVLAHRIVWSAVCMFLVLVVARRLGDLRRLSVRAWFQLLAASALISINWGIYIWAVTHGHVVDAALGYFINPLVTVAFGVLIFRERLAKAQWAALGLGAAAVTVLTVDYGRPPVIALVLACSFATYGLVKKVVPLDALRGIAAEGVVAAPFALAFLIGLAVTGRSEFGSSAGHAALMMATGPVTLIPLLLFSVAAQRVPLSTMGLLQYLTPALQMAWGVAIAHEPMPASRWAGFALIWAALAIFTAHALLRARRTRRQSTAAGNPSVHKPA